MTARGWFERLLDTVADHGVDLTGLRERGARNPSDSELCHRLVEGLGEASNVALAREILQRWQAMDKQRRLTFTNMLAVEFDPDSDEIARVAHSYRPRDPDSLRLLLEVCEPPRQELFRRLNMAPGGTVVLVAMRAWLLENLDDHPEFKAVDADFKHLLLSWFNRGFLSLERIDWDTPASILDKLIQYEAVHPMKGWQDLRRRLANDRRCFAFFHPALPQDPLIFVEVALTRSASQSIAPLIDPAAPATDPGGADTAVFYSINNALQGLRGVSFGNFLIKQVMTELSDEFPAIRTFVTLSPVPELCKVLKNLMQGDSLNGSRDALVSLLGNRIDWLLENSAQRQPLEAIDFLLANGVSEEQRVLLDKILHDITLFYLVGMKRGDYVLDPVAHFHLSNGARLERINLFANTSARGFRESWGCMVNYRYQQTEVVSNHEKYVSHGKIAMSQELQKASQRLSGTSRHN